MDHYSFFFKLINTITPVGNLVAATLGANNVMAVYERRELILTVFAATIFWGDFDQK